MEKKSGRGTMNVGGPRDFSTFGDEDTFLGLFSHFLYEPLRSKMIEAESNLLEEFSKDVLEHTEELSKDFHLTVEEGRPYATCRTCSKLFSFHEADEHFCVDAYLLSMLTEDCFEMNEQGPKAVSKPFMCKLCPQSFATKWRCKQHVNDVHRPPQYLCHKCGGYFKRKNKLVKHRANAHGVYICEVDICSQEFKTYEDLNTHYDEQHKYIQCPRCKTSLQGLRGYQRHSSCNDPGIRSEGSNSNKDGEPLVDSESNICNQKSLDDHNVPIEFLKLNEWNKVSTSDSVRDIEDYCRWNLLSRGSYSQTVFESGNACTAIAAVAAIYAKEYRASEITPERIDEILWLGEQYYRHCRCVRNMTAQMNLTAFEVAGRFCCESPKIDVHVKVVEGTDVGTKLSGRFNFKTFKMSWKYFWESSFQYAICTVGDQSVALLKEEDRFVFLFDSHPRNVAGQRASFGRACLVVLYGTDAKKLYDYLKFNLMGQKVHPGEGSTIQDELSFMFAIEVLEINAVDPAV